MSSLILVEEEDEDDEDEDDEDEDMVLEDGARTVRCFLFEGSSLRPLSFLFHFPDSFMINSFSSSLKDEKRV